MEAAKQHALSQTETIDALFRTIDEISEQARRKCLELDKLVKAHKVAYSRRDRSESESSAA
ncbi:hypothetical protein [Pseudomonas syringae]|uniref:hypothetical protein n=1 Tax=Pseudomonas syringae TaxID=317 RepID=UPI000B2F22CB